MGNENIGGEGEEHHHLFAEVNDMLEGFQSQRGVDLVELIKDGQVVHDVTWPDQESGGGMPQVGELLDESGHVTAFIAFCNDTDGEIGSLGVAEGVFGKYVAGYFAAAEAHYYAAKADTNAGDEGKGLFASSTADLSPEERGSRAVEEVEDEIRPFYDAWLRDLGVEG
ncbi:hypothetical protein GF357_04815 [Candidatus Dojkabacteria bacterium]|nr:hypothetical protein [Candidatus Dojkabacteria bacterium]